MIVAVCALASVRPAHAQANLQVCNASPAKIYVAYAFDLLGGYEARGWRTLEAGACATLDAADYLYADDGADRVWSGQTDLCVDPDKKFDLVLPFGDECATPDIDRGFFVVDDGRTKFTFR